MAWTEKYVTDAGAGAADGSNLANAWSWATMLTTLAAGQRANYNGAITRTTSADVFTNVGTATQPMALRAVDGSGVAIVPTRTAGGALDMTGVDVITYTTGNLTCPVFFINESVSVTGAKAGGTLVLGANNIIKRSKAANTHAGSSSARALVVGTDSVVDDTDVALTGTGGWAYEATGAVKFSGGLITGGSSTGGLVLSSSRNTLVGTSMRDAAIGVTASNATHLENCSFRNISGNYLDNGSSISVVNCAAWGSGGSSKWYNSTTSVRQHFRRSNAVGNMGAADTNPGDYPIENGVTLTADPFASSANLTLNSTPGGGADCKGVGQHPYTDIGAWQVQASAGSPIAGNMRGGFING